MKRSVFPVLIFLASLSLAHSGWARGPVTVQQSPGRVVLANDFLERVLSLRDEGVRTVQIGNKLSARAYPVSGDEFELCLTYERIGYEVGSENPLVLTARDFRVTRTSVQDVEGGKRVVFDLALRHSPQASTGLEGTLVYELRAEDFYTRHWLTLRTTGRGTFFIDRLAVGKFRWGGPDLRHGGFGQPLLGDDVFLGLEQPTSLNTVQGAEVSLGAWAGLNIPSDGFTSEPAVIGVAAPGATHAAFMDYVKRIRAVPEKLFVIYNTWYDLQGLVMNPENLAQRLRQFDAALVQKYGIRLDSFVLDDGWSNPTDLWDIDAARFPNGFRDLVSALKPLGSKLGLWFGPIGGYGGETVVKREVRTASGLKRGMEVTSNGEYLCLAGKNYSKYFRETLLAMQRDYDVNYFKLDGIPFGCNQPDHGHPVGIYSREADARVFIDILRALRSQSPDVFLNITTSIWLSPWWLKYADTVWMGGADTGYFESVPAMTPRQSAMTYRDAVFYNDFRRHDAQFPMSSLMTHGVIKAKFNMLGGEHESLDDWKDAVVNALSVGTMLIKLYPTPELLSDEEWGALGKSLQWMKANAHPMIDNSTLVLGDPGLREPYGFLHSSSAKTIITLRNPFVRPAPISLKLNAQSGFEPREGAFVAEVVYPFREYLPGTLRYGDTLRTELGAYEQRVIELRRVEGPEVSLTGARYSAGASASDEVALRVYGAEGSTIAVNLQPSSAILEVQVDGQKAEVKLGSEQAAVTLRFPEGKTRQGLVSFSPPSVRLSGQGDASRLLSISSSVQIPADLRDAQFALLLEPVEETKSIKAVARDNGKSVPVAAENGGRGLWYWFTTGLQPGSHSVDVEIQFPQGARTSAHLSGWLLGKRALASREVRLKLKPGEKIKTPLENLLPASSEVERKTYPVFDQSVP